MLTSLSGKTRSLKFVLRRAAIVAAVTKPVFPLAPTVSWLIVVGDTAPTRLQRQPAIDPLAEKAN
jgi:hypothetical protein